MRAILDFDDAGACDDEPAKGVTVGDVRAWHDEIKRLNYALCALRQTALSAVGHVGFANYAHREAAASKAVSQSFANGEYVDPDEM